jgi:hypothetical protein
MNQKHRPGELSLTRRLAGVESLTLQVNKLYRPPVTPEPEQGTRLTECLQRILYPPLTRILAPAGCGKTCRPDSGPLPGQRAGPRPRDHRHQSLRSVSVLSLAGVGGRGPHEAGTYPLPATASL